MADRGGHWPGRRVLVLGCTGFLGTWVVRGLLARGAEVVGLVRDPNRPSDFFRDKLYRHVHVVRGRADDRVRLRSLVHTYEVQTVFQLAAGPDGVAGETTRAAVAAAGAVPVVVPVRQGGTVRARPDALGAGSPAAVTVVRLPFLFGGGDRRWDRWIPRLLLEAARGCPLPVPPPEAAAAPVVGVRDAVDALLADPAAPCEPARSPLPFRELTVTPAGTGADLYAAGSRQRTAGLRLHRPAGALAPAAPGPRPTLDEAVAEAVEWYRTAVPPAEYPAPLPAHRAAA